MGHANTGVAAFGLLIAALALAGLSRKLRVSAPVVLVVAGIVVSFVPHLPNYTLRPDIVLALFLPPLLYSASLESSLIGFRQNLRAIGSLSVGLVLATTVAVGFATHLVFPALPLPAAFALGAIVAPPDAVAAAAIGRELGLPRRLLRILGGESLVNDATALTVYRVALAAATGSGVTLLGGVGMFLLAAIGGVGVGLVAGYAFQFVRERIGESVIENAFSLITPFAAYFVAEQIHASGVLAVVITGLYLGHHEAKTSYAARLEARALWRMADFLLESVVFLLIGLQLPTVIRGLSKYSVSTVLWTTGVVLAIVILIRIVWVYPFTYGPRWLSPRIRSHEPPPTWQGVAVVSWAGMRGVVSLAAAFALPESFPGRPLILFITFAVVLGTLVLQGFTLPWLIRTLDVKAGDEEYKDRLSEASAQHRAANAAIERLDSIVAEEEPGPPPEVVDRLRAMTEFRRNGAWERLGGASGPDGGETPSAAFRRVRQNLISAERDVFLALRDEGRLDDDVLRQIVYELDLEEAMLDWRN
ncbi:MAG: Na+/H+ antiporter [Actinomycetia bacterium]|nr:Na+/H+ antiporter [Actinomycetes bacterium]